MSDISIIGNAAVGNIGSSIAPIKQKSPVEVITTPEEIIAEPADRVEFSHLAQMIEKIHQLPSVRQERVDAIKEALANDAYMTTDKLDVAFDRLINEVVQ